MSLPIRTSIDDGIGLDVFCKCGHTGYVPAEVAAARLDLELSFDQVAFHLVCKICGAKGGALQVRFSIGDYYDRCRANGSLIPS